MNRKRPPTPEFDWHILFLGRIYSFTGWLGLLGGVFLLLTLANGQAVASGTQPTAFGMPTALSAFLLIGWSIILLSFSGDIRKDQRWSTGIGGWLIGAFQLISVPIGTAIGLYTLWVLFHYRGFFSVST